MPRLTPENKELRAAEMREKICRTFAELFAVDGEVSMDRLAETVGVAKGTIYNYFKDKSELITAVMETRRVLMVELMERTIPPEAPPEEQLGSFIRIMIDDFNRHRHLRTEYLRNNPVRPVPGKIRPGDILKRIIRRGIELGVFRENDVDEAGLFVFCSLTGKFRYLLLHNRDADPETEYRIVMNFLLAALKK